MYFCKDENGKPGKFKPEKPAWLHKSNFLCAYTANELMVLPCPLPAVPVRANELMVLPCP